MYILDNFKVGIDIRDDATIAGIPAFLQVTNVKFSNSTTNVTGRNSNGDPVDVSGTVAENPNATGAGNGTGVPAWAQGWTVGL